jgi:uncharacterized membrane protein
MNRIDHLLAALLWLAGILVVAGITHIAAIFALPKLAAKDVFARVSELAKPGQAPILPLALTGKSFISFPDPAMVQSICPFNLSEGGLRLHADVEPDRFLSLSFRTSTGDVFYSMSDLAAQQGRIDVVVLTPAQLEVVEADDDEDNPSQDLRLIAPEAKGFVIISALAAYQGERTAAEERVKSVACTVEQIAPE